MSDQSEGYGVILCTILVAAVLAVLPLERSLAWWRPEWMLLVLLYWAIALPHRVGLLTALLLGFLVDVMEGASIGQNMLSLSVVVTLSGLMYQRLRVFTLLQQASVVFVLAGIHQLLGQWIQGLQGGGASSFSFLLPAVTSALLWPVVMPVLRGLRRSYHVS
ncbi:MAG: rod shape-determining protein MreD [Congregibacter sp.]